MLQQYNPRLLALVDTLHSICKEKSGTDEDSINEVIDGKFTDELKIKVSTLINKPVVIMNKHMIIYLKFV